MNTDVRFRRGRAGLIGIIAFILGMGAMRYMMLFSRDALLTRASIELRPGTNTFRTTLPLGSYSAILMHSAEPLQRGGPQPVVKAESIIKFEATQSGVTLDSSTNGPRLSIAPQPGFATVEIVAVVLEPCYLNFGHAK